jgi:hypothetical protein
MTRRRALFPAVVLGSGKVLVVGGISGDLPTVGPLCELFDPVTGTWSSTGSLANGRQGHIAALLSDGRVLVAAGLGDGMPSSLAIEVYDPSSGSWSTVGTDVPRNLAAAALLNDGRVLVAGGSGNGPQILTTSVILSSSAPANPAGSMSTPRYNHQAVKLADGRVLVMGGTTTGGGGTATAEIFDPSTYLWTSTASMHEARTYFTASLLGSGKVLVAGGLGSASLQSCELYDPATGTWSYTGSLSQPHLEHAAVVTPGGAVLVMGGYGSGTTISPKVERYDPATELWTVVGPLSAGRRIFPIAQLPSNRYLIVGGVDYANNYTGTAEIYQEDCAPATCAAQGKDCGAIGNGCGGSLNCGTCQSGYLCTANVCTACMPTSCAAQSKDCGSVPDGCGGNLQCGQCVAGMVCSANVCVPCVPTTCSAQGKECGAIPDGCGGSIDCGSCSGGLLCTLGNLCCSPATCADQGKDCGTLADGCGGTLGCGVCSAGYSCVNNVCTGCVPTTCAASGKNCGTLVDGCGGTLDCGTCSAGYSCATNVCTIADATAAYDSALGAPRCQSGRSCDSGTLLNGRGTKGPETNAPNTIHSTCADGAIGTYHLDESLDRLRITSVDGNPLTAGHPVRIDATVWAYSGYSSDKLDLYYASDANNPTWTFIATLTPVSAGAQVLSATFVPPSGMLQAIRGTFRFGGTVGSCTSGSYDDHDDLAFPVSTPPDLAPPTTTLTSPADGATLVGTATLAASAGDDIGVTKVEFYLDGGPLLGTSTVPPYSMSWYTFGAVNGLHYLTSKAYDASGKTGTSAPVSVTINNDHTSPATSLTLPAPGAVLSGAVTLIATASDNLGVTSVEFWDGSTKLGTATTGPYSLNWNTTGAANGAHTLRSIAFDAASNSGTSAGVNVTVSNGTGGGMAVYDTILKVPKCASLGSACDSGGLLTGRGGSETNYPNTINASCSDGVGGTFHSDESLDRLKVSTFDGGPLAPGKSVRIDATVWTYSTSADFLDLYYAANANSPSWVFIGTLFPTTIGAQTLSAAYTLPQGGLQAIRGVYRYYGASATCTTGAFDDHDDLVFASQ